MIRLKKLITEFVASYDVKEVIRLLKKQKVDPDIVSPNYISDFAYSKNIKLKSEEIVWISDNYGDSLQENIVKRFSLFTGRRPVEFDKKIQKPFIKKIDAEMKQLNGKWTGENYLFKTEEDAKKAQGILDKLKKEWEEILKEFPEGSRDFQTKIASDYFDFNKKHNL